MHDPTPSTFQSELMFDRRSVLLSGDMQAISDTCGNAVTLLPTLEDLRVFIQSSYELSSNPLNHLRVTFPDFDWIYRDFEKVRDLLEIQEGFDYAWIAKSNGQGTQIVIANRRSEGPRFKILYGLTSHWTPNKQLISEFGISGFRFVF